jgi:hypothetical protein
MGAAMINADMFHAAALIVRFLKRHNIDLKKVSFVLRAHDDYTLAQMEAGMRLDWPKEQYGFPLDGSRNFNIHGITLTLSSLDRSR